MVPIRFQVDLFRVDSPKASETLEDVQATAVLVETDSIMVLAQDHPDQDLPTHLKDHLHLLQGPLQGALQLDHLHLLQGPLQGVLQQDHPQDLQQDHPQDHSCQVDKEAVLDPIDQLVAPQHQVVSEVTMDLLDVPDLPVALDPLVVQDPVVVLDLLVVPDPLVTVAAMDLPDSVVAMVAQDLVVTMDGLELIMAHKNLVEVAKAAVSKVEDLLNNNLADPTALHQ